MMYLISFIVFLLVIAAMSIGYWLQGKVVQGSCGGLGSIGIEKACTCDQPCDARIKREARAAEQQKRLEEWSKDRIL